MKRKILTLSVLFFSCATPPQPASPVVVDIMPPTDSYFPEQKYDEPAQEEEFFREKMIKEVIKYVKKMPPGNIYVRNGGGNFAYNYGASQYCVSNPSNLHQNGQKYNGMATLVYSRTTINEVALFDIPPLGSVDGIAQISINYRNGEEADADYYPASEPAQKFYESMLASLHKELQQHFSKGRPWSSFGTEREIDDPERKLEKAYEEMMADLNTKNSAPKEEVELLAPCEK